MVGLLCWGPSGSDVSDGKTVWTKMVWTKFARDFVVLGFFVSLLAACTMGLGIANIAITWYFYCRAPDFCPDSSAKYAVPITLTWVASGIWASIAVFITGVMAARLVRDPVRRAPLFFVIAFVTAVFFIPAMIVLTSVQVYFVIEKGMWPGDEWNIVPPLILIGLAVIEWFLVAAMIVYLCVHKRARGGSWEPLQEAESDGALPDCGCGSAYYYPSRIYEVTDKSALPLDAGAHPEPKPLSFDTQPLPLCMDDDHAAPLSGGPSKGPRRGDFPVYKGATVSDMSGPSMAVYDAKFARYHPKD